MTKLKLGLKWAIILEQDEPFNSNIADVFVLDLFETPASLVKSLKDQGKTVIAYFSAGSFEPWRPDAKLYSKADIGKKMKGWDEYWVNISSYKIRDIIKSRIYMAHVKGFDGVDFDNVDLYQQKSGFGFCETTNISFLGSIAGQAHDFGLVCGLKNCPELAAYLVGDFDFSINEQASEYNEQNEYYFFTKFGKPVIEIEYKKPSKATIDKAKKLKYELLYYPSENLKANFVRY